MVFGVLFATFFVECGMLQNYLLFDDPTELARGPSSRLDPPARLSEQGVQEAQPFLMQRAWEAQPRSVDKHSTD